MGDLVQLEGQTQTVRLVGVDCASQTLFVSQPLVWTAGQGVSLPFSGNRPDPGAHETAPAGAGPPAAPTNLSVSP